MYIFRSVLIVMIIALAALASFDYGRTQGTRQFTTEDARNIVGEVIEKIEDLYVIEEKIPGIVASLEAYLEAGRYDVIDMEILADLIDGDIKQSSNDHHMHFWWEPEFNAILRGAPDDSGESPEEIALYNAEASADNFGVARVDRLPGKIGYLELTSFWGETSGAEEKIRAAMELLYGSNAIIIDLRKNGGGHPWTGRIVQSYFFDEPTLVWRFYNREKDETTEGWTASPVPEKRMTGVPLYVLTSGRTASAAEAFAYAAGAFEIGTVVGQRTVGAAHRTNTFPIGDDFLLRISIAKPISPITGGNWEGAGVEPGIEVEDATDAHLVARIHALETLKGERSGGEEVFDLEWALLEVRALQSPPKLSENELLGFVGTYGNRKIFYDEGELYYQLGERAKVKLIPLTETIFKHPFRDYYRVRFITEGSNTIAMEGLYDDGRISRYEKSGVPGRDE